jgi:hypothetical protein
MAFDFKDIQDEDEDESKPTKPEEKIPVELDAEGNTVVKLSDRASATIKELNGFQSIQIDQMLPPEANGMLMTKLYALYALKSLTINGEVIPQRARNDAEIKAVAKRLTQREMFALMAAYAQEFMGNPLTSEEIKKEPAAPQGV